MSFSSQYVVHVCTTARGVSLQCLPSIVMCQIYCMQVITSKSLLGILEHGQAVLLQTGGHLSRDRAAGALDILVLPQLQELFAASLHNLGIGSWTL